GRTVVFAHTVGPTCLGDTYVTANTVPNILFEVVAGGALASLVVPVLAGPLARGDRDHAGRTASALLSWALLVSLPLTAVGLLLARPLVGLLAGAGSQGCTRHDELVIGTRMLLVFMPQVLFYALCIVLTGVLQAHRRFLAPAVGPLLSSVVVIGAYLLFGAQHPSSNLAQVSLRAQLILSIGTTLGVVALALPLLVPVSRLHLRLRPTLRFPEAVGRQVATLAVAGAVTLAAQQLSVAVAVRLAHRGDAGTLVLYNLAWTVFLVPWAVLAVPVATSAFPLLAARAEERDSVAFASVAASALRIVVASAFVAAAVLAATAVPVARVLALRVPGNGDTAALALTLAAFAPGLVGYGLVACAGRALYARQSWRPAAVSICLGWVAVVVADVVLVTAFDARWRVVALGIGNSIGMTVAGGALLYALAREAGPSALAGLRRTGPAAFAGAVVGFAAGGALSRELGRQLGDGSVSGAVVVSILAAVVAGASSIAVWLLCEPHQQRALLWHQLGGMRRRIADG
ncbi:MAG: putative peptidoglycan lipid flippase, partial [Actinomycetota bacterium]|nr:putative peptidoglycan lipid flippase [Actinomycetota bacterium]